MIVEKTNEKIYKTNKGDFKISTSKKKLRLEEIHAFLKNAYWCKNIPKSILRKSIKGSICFGVYYKKRQIGFARVVTDKATFGYLADVFILPEYQGLGLGKWLVETILNYPKFKYFRSWSLATKDAHGLYAKFGFKPLAEPENRMLKTNFTAY